MRYPRSCDEAKRLLRREMASLTAEMSTLRKARKSLSEAKAALSEETYQARWKELFPDLFCPFVDGTYNDFPVDGDGVPLRYEADGTLTGYKFGSQGFQWVDPEKRRLAEETANSR